MVYKDINKKKEYQRKYRESHKKEIKEYYLDNKEDFLLREKQRRKTNEKEIKEYKKEYYQLHKEDQKIKAKEYKNIHPENHLFKLAKRRAKLFNIKFNIEKSDIKIPKYCPILKFLLYFGNRKNKNNSPSLDRIDNAKGYIKGNIQVISHKANSMKRDATKNELINFAKWINKTLMGDKYE